MESNNSKLFYCFLPRLLSSIFQIIDEWHDLIELIMRKFMKKLKSDGTIHKTAAPESNFGFNCNEGINIYLITDFFALDLQ